MSQNTNHHRVVIIGTGFGGTMTAIPLAAKFKERNQGKPPEAWETILMLERGTWWTTPVSTVQDKEVKTAEFIANRGQPVQYWSSLNSFRGFLDIFSRCFRRTADDTIFTRLFKSLRNEDGLFDFTMLGTRGFLGLFGRKSDGVSIIRANGVGGGSLIYSNITIQPPNFIFTDPRWPLTWTDAEREHYFNFARHAISFSVLSALQLKQAGGSFPYMHPTRNMPPVSVNAGLSNIAARTAHLKPHWSIVPDPNNPTNPRGVKRLTSNPPAAPGAPPVKDRANDIWLDRARVFQTAVKELTSDYGLVDLAINDLTPEDSALGLPGETLPANYSQEQEVNYCERQGRCNVGCLPGARHTLNKQLMRAILGRPKRYKPPSQPVGLPGGDDDPPDFDNLKLEALAEVDVIAALPGGGYEVRYRKRDAADPSSYTEQRVTADIVIVAAGCLGTNELLLRSKARGTLPNLSERVGFGFSTNGDYLAFLDKTDKRASLIRGPVTSSFAHFNTEQPGTGPESAPNAPDPTFFHTLEDQGIPPAFAPVFGEGLPLMKTLVQNGGGGGFLVRAVLRYVKKRVPQLIKEIWRNNLVRADFYKSEEERISNFMCVVAMGRDASVGQFRLGQAGETPLRLRRTDGLEFWNDPIYTKINDSLKRLALKLRPATSQEEFYNPFLTDTAQAAGAKSIALSHPLGGCRMAKAAADGVVDEFGHVFDASLDGARPFYKGLYVADGAIIPTALGVNPSLTISALSLRIVDNIIEELKAGII
ncbi:MAG TPA: GMC family oxidoreductase [Pyrinomonadaceae bacterium]|jgi:choline dehydrogenase-like flavoprotein